MPKAGIYGPNYKSIEDCFLGTPKFQHKSYKFVFSGLFYVQKLYGQIYFLNYKF
jgi:hypothetical protein